MNIIGIAGRAGAGKDTVADLLVKNHSFVKVACADAMKKFCQEMFDFSTDQLWGPSSRRNEPDKRYPRSHEWTPIARDLKVCDCCGVNNERRFNKISDEVPQCFLTPRFALQQLGSEWGRRMYPDVRINKVIAAASALLGNRNVDDDEHGVFFTYYSAERGIHRQHHGYEWNDYGRPEVTVGEPLPPKPIAGVVVSDIRFDNELAAVRAAGGRIWYRPGGGLEGPAGQHGSERALTPRWEHEESWVIPWADDVTTLPAIVARIMEETST